MLLERAAEYFGDAALPGMMRQVVLRIQLVKKWRALALTAEPSGKSSSRVQNETFTATIALATFP